MQMKEQLNNEYSKLMQHIIEDSFKGASDYKTLVKNDIEIIDPCLNNVIEYTVKMYDSYENENRVSFLDLDTQPINKYIVLIVLETTKFLL